LEPGGIVAATTLLIAQGVLVKKQNRKTATASSKGRIAAPSDKGQAANGTSQLFAHFASRTAHLAGKPLTFFIAVGLVVAWAATGPLFGFSDTWQLVINTSTTIVTFLMVFLIQNTQNRDTLALQVKLAELIISMQGAKNKVATAEDLCEEDLEQLHEEYRKRADETLAHLRHKRDQLKKAS
jgi:low affinity Fe/Cu permease